MSEDAIQRSIIDRLRVLGCFVAHIANQSNGTAGFQRKLRSLGQRWGMPDLYVARKGRHALLEVKAPGGRLSASQKDCIADLEHHQVPVFVVTDQDQAVAALMRAGFDFGPRGRGMVL